MKAPGLDLPATGLPCPYPTPYPPSGEDGHSGRLWTWNALADRARRGNVLVKGPLFIAKVGKAALAVWRLLIRWRGPNGLAWPSRAALAKHAALTVHQVRTALRRLRLLRLVEDAGYLPRGGRERWHYEVLGEPADGRLRAVWVRAAAAREIQRANAHGGKRKGAGRPKGSTAGANQAAPLANQAAPRITKPYPLPPTGGESKARAGARESAIQEDQTMTESNTLGTGAGATLRADFDAAVERATLAGVLPEAPDPQTIRAVRVPPPARLDPEAGMTERVRTLLACYRGAVTARTGKRCGVGLSGDPKRSRYWRALCAAVKALHEHEIAPAAWAAWSVDQWLAKEDGKAPPLPWVWSAKRIAQHRGWFRRTAGDHVAPLVMPRAARDVLTAWDRVLRLLWTEYAGGALDEATVASAVAAVLACPEAHYLDEWRGFARAALREVERAAADMASVSATGEVWLWG